MSIDKFKHGVCEVMPPSSEFWRPQFFTSDMGIITKVGILVDISEVTSTEYIDLAFDPKAVGGKVGEKFKHEIIKELERVLKELKGN